MSDFYQFLVLNTFYGEPLKGQSLERALLAISSTKRPLRRASKGPVVINVFIFIKIYTFPPPERCSQVLGFIFLSVLQGALARLDPCSEAREALK